MTERDFVESIKKERKKAIDRADRKYAKQFMQPKISKRILVIGILVICLYLVYSSIMLFREPSIYELTTNQITNVNQISNVTEHIIKGDKQMVCLGSPDSDEMVCYREKE